MGTTTEREKQGKKRKGLFNKVDSFETSSVTRLCRTWRFNWRHFFQKYSAGDGEGN